MNKHLFSNVCFISRHKGYLKLADTSLHFKKYILVTVGQYLLL